jgi:hypothetical protein
VSHPTRAEFQRLLASGELFERYAQMTKELESRVDDTQYAKPLATASTNEAIRALIANWRRRGRGECTSIPNAVALGGLLNCANELERALTDPMSEMTWDMRVTDNGVDEATITRLREFLCFSHGHAGQYGDDGELQCGQCAAFGAWDYRRAPLAVLLDTIQAVCMDRLRPAFGLPQAVAAVDPHVDSTGKPTTRVTHSNS